MNFLTAPPEINSKLMFTGPGSSPMLQIATAWEGLASELGSVADSLSSLISDLAGQAWQGPASVAMAAAVAPYSAWLAALAGDASGAAALAQAGAGAFESALAATVHPMLVSLNRSNLVQAATSNLFGENASVIAAIESEYERMWAKDITAMLGYRAGASAAVANLAEFPQSLRSLPRADSGIGRPFSPSTGGSAGVSNSRTGNGVDAGCPGTAEFDEPDADSVGTSSSDRFLNIGWNNFGADTTAVANNGVLRFMKPRGVGAGSTSARDRSRCG